MRVKQFAIGTVVNSIEQYRAFKESFIAAGFTEDHCSYTVFDNTKSNAHEPYAAFNALQAATTEPYLILCHQDVLADQGHGYPELLAIIEQLDRIDPSWAIAGNAGCDARMQLIRHINDRHGNETHVAEPIRVVSLDENFLLIKRAAGLTCEHGISGFHLYATYLCLQAARKGQGSYVIGFSLTHTGKGAIDRSYYEIEHDVEDQMGGDYGFRVVRTPSGSLVLSRHPLLRKMLRNQRVRNAIVWRVAHLRQRRISQANPA